MAYIRSFVNRTLLLGFNDRSNTIYSPETAVFSVLEIADFTRNLSVEAK